MYIIDGVAYAGEPTRSIAVESAQSVGDLCMLVTFSTGETRLWDASSIVQFDTFKPLANNAALASFELDHGVMTWLNGALDIAPEELYRQSTPYEVKEALSEQA